MRLISALTDWWEEERDRAPLWLPVFMGAGVLAYFSLRFEPALWTGPLAAAVFAGLSLRWRLLFMPVAAAAIGFTSAQMAAARAPPMDWRLPTHAVILTGTVTAIEELAQGRRIKLHPVTLNNDPAPLARAVRIRLRNNDETELAAGDRVRARALIRPPAAPAYPGAWDLQRDAWFNGLGASGYTLGTVERLEPATLGWLAGLIEWLREIISTRVMTVIPGPAGAVAATLLTGSPLAIPEADRAAFRDSGLAHLLAVAGLHIGTVMGFIMLLARRGFALSPYASLHWPTRKLAGACALAAGSFYMLLTGSHVPTIRSFVMASLFTLALLAERRPFSLRGLALAGVVLMLFAPQEVPGVSFQMSFSAVLALIAGYEALRPWLRRLHGPDWRQRALSHIVALALTSALAGSASAPYGAYHFGQIQIYFILANMFAVPLTAVLALPAGLIALVLMPLHLDALMLVPMGWSVEAIVWIARATSALPAATFRVPHMPGWGLAVFSLGLAWLCLWRSRVRLLGTGAMAGGIASLLLAHPPDILVSDDARLIAVRTASGAFAQQTQGSSRFLRDSWAAYWGLPGLAQLPKSAGDVAEGGVAEGDGAKGDGAKGDGADGAISCDAAGCRLRPYADRPMALLARGASKRESCTGISVIVSAEPARGLCPRPWPGLVDRFTVWRNGATAIWLEPAGAVILTDRQARGERPWVPPPPQPRAQQPSRLPPAEAEH